MLKERIIAYNPWNKLNDTEKFQIFTEVDKVLAKRHILWQRYSRGIDFETPSVQFAQTDDTMTTANITEQDTKRLQILLEKFIVDIAAGYLSGQVEYDVDATDDIQAKVNRLIFGKDPITADEALELGYIIDTISASNTDETETTHLFRDMVLFGSCYERVQDLNKNGYKYYYLDGINTVAVWDDSIQPKLMAVVQAYRKQIDGKSWKHLYRVYLPNKIEIYSRFTKKEDKSETIKLEDTIKHEWKEVPVVVYESQFSILDKCASIITAFETLINNVRNTYKYNAEDCKMKIAGYRPQNPITIPNPEFKDNLPESNSNPRMVLNPARILEDNAVLASKTFYVQEHGDANWLVKPVDANDTTTMLKYYLDLIFQLAGIPNTSDLAFNSADLNASAIDRKFYIMSIITSELREGMVTLIRNRFRLFLERINLKNHTSYDINNVRITIGNNLPSMTDETIDQMLRLDGILSEETILEKLGYDFETESQRKENELNARMAQFGEIGPQNDDNSQNSDASGGNGDRKTGTDVIRADRKVQSGNKKNIQTNINRENAKTVRHSTSISSPIGAEHRGN